ncbi:MAG: methyltransferase domain-containing protein [Candidatus Bilamarchaeaceae archaeon]
MKKSTAPKPYLSPLLKKLKRGPAVTLPKDAGLIIAYTSVGKDSTVLEIGSGSGFLSLQIANIAKKVISYEKRAEFLKIAEENAKRLGFDNVSFKLRDVVKDGIDENDEIFDLVVCDIPDAEKVVPIVLKVLKKGCFAVAHCLHIEQAKAFALECQKHCDEVFMTECITRDYEVRDFGVRPKHFGLMHSAYLVFAKK